MNVVALDLSLTATGVAWPDASAMSILTSPKDTLPDRLRFIRSRILEPYHVLCGFPTVVVIEDLPFTRNNAAGQLGMVHGVIRLAIDDLVNEGLCAGVVFPVSGSVKKYATGKGNANKQQMLAEAIRRLGYEGSSDNEADALWLRAMAMDHYGEPVVQMPAANREALAKVEWPELEPVT